MEDLAAFHSKQRPRGGCPCTCRSRTERAANPLYAVKMASLLAYSEADILNKEHLETMLEAVEEIAEAGVAASTDAVLRSRA